MKKEYEAPEMEMIRLSLGKDVLAVSDPEGGHGSAGSLEPPDPGLDDGF